MTAICCMHYTVYQADFSSNTIYSTHEKAELWMIDTVKVELNHVPIDIAVCILETIYEFKY